MVAWFMVFHATVNNILVKSWRPVLLVEETRVPDLPQVTDKLSHNVVSSTPRNEQGSNSQL
jgi:hypothetical protein